MKLTPDLIQQSAQYINPVRDRELDLRGYKVPIIENLGATFDQFDTIDFSDNDIRKLDGFPLLKRLKCILLSNNRVCRIGEHLEENIPNLESLILTNNHINELRDIDPLSTVASLRCLSLLKNPVTTKKHYRLYIIHKLPQLRLIDFRKVRQRERDDAQKLFKGKRGKQFEKEIAKIVSIFPPGGNRPGGRLEDKPYTRSTADVQAIRNAIKEATTLEQVERLQQILKSGQFMEMEAKRLSDRASKRGRNDE